MHLARVNKQIIFRGSLKFGGLYCGDDNEYLASVVSVSESGGDRQPSDIAGRSVFL